MCYGVPTARPATRLHSPRTRVRSGAGGVQNRPKTSGCARVATRRVRTRALPPCAISRGVDRWPMTAAAARAACDLLRCAASRRLPEQPERTGVLDAAVGTPGAEECAGRAVARSRLNLVAPALDDDVQPLPLARTRAARPVAHVGSWLCGWGSGARQSRCLAPVVWATASTSSLWYAVRTPETDMPAAAARSAKVYGRGWTNSRP